MKRTIPLVITALVGFTLVIAAFVPALVSLSELGAVFFDILAAIAFILGGGNLLRNHGEKIYRQHQGWGYSLIALVSFLAMLSFGLGKLGVPTPYNQGLWTDLMRSGETVGLVQLNRLAGEYTLMAAVRKAPPGQPLELRIDGEVKATVPVESNGRGSLTLAYDADDPEADPAHAWLAAVPAGASIAVGPLTDALEPYSSLTGEFNANGGWFWWLYEFGFQPLQQTTFAMLAFYVASAAFRAFRAKNIESVLLLGTAFLILLGRTYAGTKLTEWAADPLEDPQGLWEQFLSFFYMPYLSEWFMDVFNTAGNRAIMIGIALGVAATSLKVLLGIDRSYLGSDRG